MKKTSHNNVILLLGLSVLFAFTAFSVTGCIKPEPYVIEIFIHDTIDINIVLNTIIETDSISHDTVIVKETVELIKFDTITSNSAIIEGVVEGSSTYSEFAYGVCWGINSYPTVENNHSEPNQFSQSDRFIIEMRDLRANTKYYVRPYIYKSNQYYYGKDSKDFTTNH